MVGPIIRQPAPAPATAATATRIERVAADTANQGTGNLIWAPSGARGSTSALADVAKWAAPDPKVARAVRVTFFATNPGATPAAFDASAPLWGAMALITYTGQNGIAVKRWVACPADFTIVASSIRVQALAVGLPYQAFPTNCGPNSTATPRPFQVAATFADDEADDSFPSIALYPASFATTAGNGSAVGSAGRTSLAYFPGVAAAASGFLRALTITNASAATVYICVLDLPSAVGNVVDQDFYTYSSCVPIAVPAGATVVRTFDDLAMFWGPWIGVLSSLSAPALTDGSLVFVEAEYAPIVTPGF